MKIEHFEHSLFDGIWGLSCVENLVLFGIKQCGKPFEYLYYDSFLTLSELELGFITKQDTFVDFKSINKIQNTAVKENWIDIQFDDSQFFNNDLLQYNNAFRLIMVKSNFMSNKFQTNAWRNDHFVLLYPRDTNYYYINDHPPCRDTISSKEIHSYFAGKSIVIKIKENINEDYLYYLNKLKYKTINNDYHELKSNDILLLRDILGVLRIIRRRIFKFIYKEEIPEIFNSYIKDLDRFYASIEYMRVKGKIDYIKLGMLKKELAQQEYLITEKVIDRIHKSI